ncbi:hypothetical protein [Variovorax boronicumulans]|uniref:hypothetical protein n=1 Tax=Variovorax boronicumulans TaxID=436515 RepID=UPI00278423B8|nr:hypothetical protein [Variovorax boronicumulans]MDQ0040864.1 hypothetical protein [Variovorax boronicumulans]
MKTGLDGFATLRKRDPVDILKITNIDGVAPKGDGRVIEPTRPSMKNHPVKDRTSHDE